MTGIRFYIIFLWLDHRLYGLDLCITLIFNKITGLYEVPQTHKNYLELIDFLYVFRLRLFVSTINTYIKLFPFVH